ncbi:MAG: hypothetical protein QW196_00335 [Sulfolobales archaeon]
MHRITAKDNKIWIQSEYGGIFWSVNSQKLDGRLRIYAVGLLLALAVKYRTTISVEEGYYYLNIQAGQTSLSWDYSPEINIQALKKLTERLEKQLALKSYSDAPHRLP